ncbi:MAG TPA: ABC transporter permease [Clostridiales bacterium]|nr:ABC transporter permease [Clostridiales bacterium]
MKKLKSALYGVISFGVLLLLWQLAITLTGSTRFPTPAAVIVRFFRSMIEPMGPYRLWGHVLWSLSRVMVGFCTAAALGIILGLTMGWFDTVRAIFKPLFDLLRPIAPLAWIPLAILWLGIEEKSKYFLIFIASFVPFTLNAYAGAVKTNRQLIGAAKMLGANDTQIFFKIVIPSAVPQIFSGAQVALSNAWMTMLAAEMIRSSYGIGWVIIAGQQVNDMPQMISGMIAIGMVGFLLATGMRLMERRLLVWNNQGR